MSTENDHQNGREEGAKTPLLGKRTKFSSPLPTFPTKTALFETYALQAAARELLPNERIAKCLRRIIPKQDHVQLWRDKNEEHKSAFWGNLMHCGSVWRCPPDARKITERRRQELTEATNRAEAMGLSLVLVTYTFRHKQGDNLREILKRKMDALKYLKGGKAWQGFTKRLGIVGSIRGLECTVGYNGWHPHDHDLTFCEKDKLDPEAIRAFIGPRWLDVLETCGLSATLEVGVDVRTARKDIAAYVTKYAKEPQWTLAHEVAKAPVKKARDDRHRSPFQLLADYLAGDRQAGRLFVEFAHAFKGKQQLRWSSGLWELLQMPDEEKTDEQLAEEKREDAELFARIAREDWALILWHEWRGEIRARMIEIAAAGDVQALRDYLAEFGVELSQC